MGVCRLLYFGAFYLLLWWLTMKWLSIAHHLLAQIRYNQWLKAGVHIKTIVHEIEYTPTDNTLDDRETKI